MKSNEFEKKLDDEKVERCVLEIYSVLKKDLNVVDCNDSQCDNEDCVLYQAVIQYIKYNLLNF
jgi:hypothetical protein